MAEIDAGKLDNKKFTICDRDYPSREIYRVHFYSVHKVGKREQAVSRNTKYGAGSNIKDGSSSSYCQLCKRTYATKANYIRHTKEIHSNK